MSENAVAAVVATFPHLAAPRDQRAAKTGRGAKCSARPSFGRSPPSSSEAADAQYFSVADEDLPAAERSAPGARTNTFTVRVPAWQIGGWSVGILAYQCAWFTCSWRTLKGWDQDRSWPPWCLKWCWKSGGHLPLRLSSRNKNWRDVGRLQPLTRVFEVKFRSGLNKTFCLLGWKMLAVPCVFWPGGDRLISVAMTHAGYQSPAEHQGEGGETGKKNMRPHIRHVGFLGEHVYLRNFWGCLFCYLWIGSEFEVKLAKKPDGTPQGGVTQGFYRIPVCMVLDGNDVGWDEQKDEKSGTQRET